MCGTMITINFITLCGRTLHLCNTFCHTNCQSNPPFPPSQYLPGNRLVSGPWYACGADKQPVASFGRDVCRQYPPIIRSPCLRHREAVTWTNSSQTSVHRSIHHRYGNYSVLLPKRSAYPLLLETRARRGTDYKKASVDGICTLRE